MKILFIVLFLASCSTSQNRHQKDSIDKVLGNLRSNLIQSDEFIERNVDSFRPLAVHTKVDFDSYKDVVVTGFEGRKIYEKVKEYYRKTLPAEAFERVVVLFSSQKLLDLQQKEYEGLDPNTFSKFQMKIPNIKNWDKKTDIIESFDELVKTSDSSIWVADLITSTMIDSFSLVSKNMQLLSRLKLASDKNLKFFDLQTRYATSEALRFTYQDFSLKELEYWQNALENKDLQLIMSHLRQALDYAYQQTFSTVSNKISMLNK